MFLNDFILLYEFYSIYVAEFYSIFGGEFYSIFVKKNGDVYVIGLPVQLHLLIAKIY